MESNRCPSCGAIIETNQEGFVTCSYCGTRVYVNSKGQIQLTSESNKTIQEKKNNKPLVVVLAVLAIALVIALCVVSNNYSHNKAEEETVVPEEVGETYAISDIEKADVGDTLVLGKFEQDNDSSTLEDIEWLVLANSGEQLTVISKYGLDHVKYDDIDNWLNSELLKSFTDEEKAYLSDIKVLNYTRAESLFESDEERVCEATPYAIANGAHVYDGSNICWWWLKTEDLVNGPHSVRTDGHIKFVDTKIDDEGYAIRPAITLDIEPSDKNLNTWNGNNNGNNNNNNNKKEEPALPIIEVLDESMNVYTYVDKSSPKDGKVYKGERFACLEYYETPGYKWYKIGTNQWLGDGNDTRIGLVSGKLKSVDTIEKDSENVPTNRKTLLINRLSNLDPYYFEEVCFNIYGLSEEKENELLEVLGDNVEDINSISFRASMNYDFSDVKVYVNDTSKEVSTYIYLYGHTDGSKIIESSIHDVSINYGEYSIQYPSDELADALKNIDYINFDFFDYSAAKGMNYMVKNILEEVYSGSGYTTYAGIKD